jgi:hypothetical protein
MGGECMGGGGMNGTLGQYVVMPDECVIPMPKNINFGEAASLVVAGATAMNVLSTGEVKKGDDGSDTRDRRYKLFYHTGKCLPKAIFTSWNVQKPDRSLAVGSSSRAESHCNIFDRRETPGCKTTGCFRPDQL